MNSLSVKRIFRRQLTNVVGDSVVVDTVVHVPQFSVALSSATSRLFSV
jgi:hypothetical protein